MISLLLPCNFEGILRNGSPTSCILISTFSITLHLDKALSHSGIILYFHSVITDPYILTPGLLAASGPPPLVTSGYFSTQGSQCAARGAVLRLTAFSSQRDLPTSVTSVLLLDSAGCHPGRCLGPVVPSSFLHCPGALCFCQLVHRKWTVLTESLVVTKGRPLRKDRQVRWAVEDAWNCDIKIPILPCAS
jgi:hypothetical protein